MEKKAMEKPITIEDSKSPSSSDDISSIGSISDGEASSASDDCFFRECIFPIMDRIFSRKEVGTGPYLEKIESWSDLEFRKHLGVPRELAYNLIDDLEASNFIANNAFGNSDVTAKSSLLIFMSFISTTDPLSYISRQFDLPEPTVSVVLRGVAEWLVSKMNDVIKWPTDSDEISRISDGFYAVNQIQKVFGAIGCTDIPIGETPCAKHDDFCNHNKYPSVNLQAVVDHRLRFIHLHCGEPGSFNKAEVLRKSPLYREAIKNKRLVFPNQTFLIGGAGYPSLSWLVSPCPTDNRRLTPEVMLFNYRYSSTGMAVEEAFLVLKGRYRRLSFFNECRDFAFISKTVVAACVLHNYCVSMARGPVPGENVEHQRTS